MRGVASLLIGIAGLPCALGAEDWRPEPDSSATKEQLALYAEASAYLPKLSTEHHARGSVQVYMYPGTGGDRACKDTTAPLYWTWYSSVLLSPILSGSSSNGCGATSPRSCPDASRYSGSFYECKLSGVNTKSYTYSGFDRGHMVNSQIMAKLYDASCQTFTMCNIAPQSPQCNQKDWLAAEYLAQDLSEAKAGVLVMQGPLYNDTTAAGRSGAQCVCGANGGTAVGTVPCSEVAKRGDCNEGDWEVRVPYGFFKTIVDTAAKTSWSFVYTKSQREQGPQITCSGVCETPQQAFLEGRKNVVAKVQEAAHFHGWEGVTAIASETCGFCKNFNATVWEEMGPVVADEEL
jgi:hypothetical protein